MPDKYYQGKYEIQNREKYIGNPDEVIYRSNYEKVFCKWCDLSQKVLRWGCEVVKVPYVNPETKKTSNYIVDFYVEIDNTKEPENPKKYLIEVKPSNELQKPSPPKKVSAKAYENFEYQAKMYIKNMEKWKAAINYAKSRGMQFRFVTEKNLFQGKWDG